MTTIKPEEVLAFVPDHIPTALWPVSEEYIATLAAPYLEHLKSRKAEWEADAQAQAEQGFAMIFCWHGVQVVWEDGRDCCCGACEEGLTVEEEAEQIARGQWFDYCQRMQLWITMTKVAKAMNMDVPTVAIDGSWVAEPVGGWQF